MVTCFSDQCQHRFTSEPVKLRGIFAELASSFH